VKQRVWLLFRAKAGIRSLAVPREPVKPTGHSGLPLNGYARPSKLIGQPRESTLAARQAALRARQLAIKRPGRRARAL